MAEVVRPWMYEEIRRRIAAEVSARPLTVWLHGSQANGTNRVSSDIDIAVDAGTSLPRATLAAITISLDESTVPYTVDLSDLQKTDPAFQARVRASGIPWLIDG
jgi:predicted nucleotidyltransferase